MNAAVDQESVVVPGRIHALRAWDPMPEAGSATVRLCSVSAGTIWPVGHVEAECDLGCAAAPGTDCSCGLYAFHPHRLDFEILADESAAGRVHGVIEAWGRTEVHRDGIRARHARIASILVPGTAPDGDLEIAQRAARTYGVPVVSLLGDDQLERYFEQELQGLSESFIDDLLRGARVHHLRPRTKSYMSRHGEPVGGFGFVHADEERVPKRFQERLPIADPAIDVIRVAGTRHRHEPLQSETFEPARPLTLVPEPGNEHDPNAIAVWDQYMHHQAGYVPRRLAPWIGERLESGEIDRVFSAWQWLDLMRGERTGLHILVSSSPRIEFG